MTMSKDRIKFFLPHRYFNRSSNTTSTMSRSACQRILCMAFNMAANESINLMNDNPDGFWVLCRPSQFARFIVHRHTEGNCINGVRDLRPKIIKAPDLYDDVSDMTGVQREDVELVAKALSLVRSDNRPCPTDRIDVSCRPARKDLPRGLCR